MAPPDFTVQRQAHCVLLSVIAFVCWALALVLALVSDNAVLFSLFRKVAASICLCGMILWSLVDVVRSWRKYKVAKQKGVE